MSLTQWNQDQARYQVVGAVVGGLVNAVSGGQGPNLASAAGSLTRRGIDAVSDYYSNNSQGSSKRLRTSKKTEKPTSKPKEKEERQAEMSNKTHAGDEIPVMPIPKSISKTCPDYFTIRLPYYEQIVFSGPKIDPADYIFRLNSIFDPNVTAAGHQPMGRDLWAGIYQYYRVISAEFTFTWLNHDEIAFSAGNTNGTAVVGYELTDNAATNLSTGVFSFIEGKQTAHRFVPGARSGGTGPASVVMRHHYTPQGFDHHITEAGIDERWTAIDLNPGVSHLILARAFAMPSQRTGNFFLECQVEISYTVQFREANTSIIKAFD